MCNGYYIYTHTHLNGYAKFGDLDMIIQNSNLIRNERVMGIIIILFGHSFYGYIHYYLNLWILIVIFI